MAIGGDFGAFWRVGGARVAKIGLRGGFFHPTTGSSLPDAVRTGAVLAEQRSFEASDVEGIVVGFRFLPRAAGLDIPGFHLHFVSADRRFGGHLLSCRTRAARARLDFDADLDLELPPGVELPAGDDALDGLARLERDDDPPS